MSELLIDNPAILGPCDQDGDAYVWCVTQGLVEYTICHPCAMIAFASGDAVTLDGSTAWDDPALPTHCEACGQAIDPRERDDWVREHAVPLFR